MYMTVENFIEMFVDPDTQKFEVWDNDKEKVIFKGCLLDIPEDLEDKILNAEISSIDNLQNDRIITLNVDIEED